MPFQGNPNAGQPDPALLNLLFQQKAQREERAYKMQQDALAAQRQAQLDAAEEARKDEAHRVKMAKDAVEIMNKTREQEGAIGETQANNRQAKAQVAEAYPFVSTPGVQVRGPSGGMAKEFGALPDRSVQNAYTQQQFGEQLDGPMNARMAALASVLSGVNPEFAKYAQTLPGQGLQTELTRTRLAGEEQAKAEQEFERQRQKEVALQEDRQQFEASQAEIKFNRSTQKFGREITALTDQIYEQEQVLKTEPPGSPKFVRAQVLRARLELGMSKKLTENVDAGHMTNVQKFMDDNVSLMQESETALQDLRAFEQLAQVNPNFLGTRGGFIQLISNAAEGVSDVVGVTNLPGRKMFQDLTLQVRDALLRDEFITDKERARLLKDMGLDNSDVLQARTDARSLTNRIAYLTTRGQNPGRFSNEQYKYNKELYALDSGSSQQAFRNLQTAIAELESISARTRARVSVYNGLLPGPLGGLNTPSGETVFAPGQGTSLPSVSGTGQQMPTHTQTPTMPSGADLDARAAELERLMRGGN